MIPSAAGFLRQDLEMGEQPGLTYRLDAEGRYVKGETDGLEAVRQAVYCILNTERYQYPIYSWNYGVELADLYGEPVTYVVPELERRIREALLCDGRVLDVNGFAFDLSRKREVHASFTVVTAFGEVRAEKGVRF